MSEDSFTTCQADWGLSFLIMSESRNMLSYKIFVINRHSLWHERYTPITDFKTQPTPYLFSHFLGKPIMTEEQFSRNTRELFLHVSRENRSWWVLKDKRFLALVFSLSLFFFFAVRSHHLKNKKSCLEVSSTKKCWEVKQSAKISVW